MNTAITSELAEHHAVSETLLVDEDFQRDLEALSALCAESLLNGGKLMLCGNGGSAADAQHVATELTIRFISDRPAIAAVALTTDTSAITAAGNDLGFDRIFARQVEAIGRPGDVLLCISTSGNSPNVLHAADAARERDISVAYFGGRDGGQMLSLADASVVVPSKTTARIQEVHILAGHILCAQMEERLGFTPSTTGEIQL